MDKPSILEVVGEHVALRKAGREYVGLCPFHSEKTPSFSVNPAKEVFYCHGCHVGGDVFTFVEKIEGIDFKTAARRLGAQIYRPSPERQQLKKEAKRIAWWVRNTSNKISDALREIGDKIRTCKIARQTPGTDRNSIVQHEAALIRQWAILCDLDDDLNNAKTALELWEQREDIDRLVEALA